MSIRFWFCITQLCGVLGGLVAMTAFIVSDDIRMPTLGIALSGLVVGVYGTALVRGLASR